MTVASQSVEIPRLRTAAIERGVGPRDGRLRLALSSRAPAFLRMHVTRHLIRVLILLAADTTTLLVLWFLLGSVVTGPFAIADGLPRGQYILAVVLGLALFGCYGSGDQRRDAGSLACAAGLGTGLALWSNLWTGSLVSMGGVPRLVVAWIVTTVVLLASRRVVDAIIHLVRPAPSHVMRAAVIGTAEQAVELIDHPAIGETPWCHLVACCDPQGRSASDASTEVAQLIRARRIDTLILAAHLDNATFAAVLDAAVTSGCQVLSFPRMAPTPMLVPRLVWRGGIAVVEHTRPGALGAALIVKRVLDVVGAAALLVALAPLMVAVGILIRLQSDGPVLFRQVRIGQGGRRFRILKFRTMVAGTDGQRGALRGNSLYTDGRLFKVPGDPRITPLGAILRRTSIDELPQLWNVLLGDMSLVGPRPPMPSEVALYRDKDYARFDVKPGITGPWQVSGRNAVCDFDEVVRLETAYIRRWSVWLDLELLWRTVPAVLSGRGAH